MRVTGFPLWTETIAVVDAGDAFTRLRRLSRRPAITAAWWARCRITRKSWDTDI